MAIFCYLVQFLEFDMLRKILLIGLWACLLTGSWTILSAQSMNVTRSWGRVLGKAHTDRDFLIYDAVCANNKLFIVGKAESGTGFELKQGENTYFQTKDDYTDAFLACMSLDGELLWSTYLPALDSGYYNAFASTVEYTENNTIIVFGNAYKLQGDLATTKELIPKCSGYIFEFEFLTGSVFYKASANNFLLKVGSATIPSYIPRIVKTKSSWTGRPWANAVTFTGFILCNLIEPPYDNPNSVFNYSYAFTTFRSEDPIEIPFSPPTTIQAVYSAAYTLTPYEFNYIQLLQSSHHQ